MEDPEKLVSDAAAALRQVLEDLKRSRAEEASFLAIAVACLRALPGVTCRRFFDSDTHSCWEWHHPHQEIQDCLQRELSYEKDGRRSGRLAEELGISIKEEED